MKRILLTLVSIILAGYSFAQVNCSTLTASFTSSVSGYHVNFTNTSTNPMIPLIYSNAFWNFGDGSSSTSLNPGHTYAATGTYSVMLINEWLDTASNMVVCTDTAYGSVTITGGGNPTNEISGTITWDSTGTGPQVGFKVWLIEFDSVANTLTAIDSVGAGGFMTATYTFSNVPAGVYRTKAAANPNGTILGNLLPTYHHSSLYWNSATLIYHAGGVTNGKDIEMINGTPTAGPGFIGGNVSTGANKGTAVGVPGVQIVLRDGTNGAVKFTYTNANGDYSFNNLAAGTYNIYPEKMNYITTPSSALTVTTGQPTVNSVNFKQTATEIKPVSTGISDLPSANLFSVYPNPSAGKVQINWAAQSTGTADVTVMDISGRTVATAKASMSRSFSMDLGNLQAGVYFVKVATAAAQHSVKIMIQH